MDTLQCIVCQNGNLVNHKKEQIIDLGYKMSQVHFFKQELHGVWYPSYDIMEKKKSMGWEPHLLLPVTGSGENVECQWVSRKG